MEYRKPIDIHEVQDSLWGCALGVLELADCLHEAGMQLWCPPQASPVFVLLTGLLRVRPREGLTIAGAEGGSWAYRSTPLDAVELAIYTDFSNCDDLVNIAVFFP